MISIQITGNLGRDAEVKQTPTGKDVTTLSVGSTPRIKRNGEWTDGETLWFTVTVWSALPQIVYSKGATVLVYGDLTQRSYEKDGVTKTRLEIQSATVGILHKSTNQKDPALKFEQASSPAEAVWSAPLDDMPF
jgi:single-strand DNA-binding protein